MMTSAADIVSAFQTAMGSGDLGAARRLLHDDMTFHGPFDVFASPEPYIEALKKLHPIVKSIRVQKKFVDGDDVCVLYDMETRSPAGTAFIAEWFQVRGGKIASIRAVFDARPFAAMFAQ